MVPKSVHPLDVPSVFRIGMPCQKRFGGTPHPWSEYRKCREVHILGGHPTDQRDVERYYVPVRSIDTAVPISRATWGHVWSEGRFVPKREGFYGSIEESFRNIWEAWNGTNVALGRGARIRYPRPKSEYYDDPLDLDGLIADGEEIPFPGRVWAEENGIQQWRELA